MYTFEVQRAGAVLWPSGKPDTRWYRSAKRFETAADADTAARRVKMTARHPRYTRVVKL